MTKKQVAFLAAVGVMSAVFAFAQTGGTICIQENSVNKGCVQYLNFQGDTAAWVNRNVAFLGISDAGVAFARYAADAGHANNADTATAAGTATYALDAGQADYAPQAGVANYALDAGQANYAPQAGNANTANTATYAADAGYANTAGTAGSAGTCDVATYALDAGRANYAPAAGVAVYALDAGAANYATSAGSAGTATTATYAADAGNVVCTGCIIADRIAGLAIDSSKLAAFAVTRAKIGLGEIDNTVIADGGIVGGNITPGGIGTPQLASMAVTNGILGPFAVTEDKIDAGAITSVKILDGAVQEGKIATGAVTVNKIGLGAVTEAKIDTGAVTVSKIGTGAVTEAKLDTGAVTETKIGTGAVTNAKIGTDAVTDIKILAGAVTEAKIGTGAVTVNKIGTDAVTDVKILNGAVTENKIGTGAVTVNKIGLGAVTDVKLATDAVTTVKIANGNVTNAKVAAQAIDWSKLDDGSPIMAWDEGRGSLLAGRVTFTANGTMGSPEANQGYTSWAVTSGTTDFYVVTDVQFRTIKDQYVSITYRTGGTTGWAASSTMRVYNVANTTQSATATMYGDGLWHTAVFDISAFTGTSTIRFDPQDGGAAIGAGATFWASNVAVGNIGVGPGGGHSLVSYRGAVGINKAVPGVDLDINGGNSQNVWARLNGFSGIPLFATQRAAGTAAAPTIVTDGTEIGRLDFRGYDGSAYRQTAYISSYVNGTPGASDMPGRLVFATTSDGAASATERMQITRDGVVAVNKPTAGGGAAIYINGTDTVYQSITTTSGTVASFPQLQIINHNTNGGFPVTAHYNSKGTAASPVALSAGDTLGDVAFYGRGTSASYIGAEIKAFTSIAPTTNISGLLTFATASAAVSATERMRIDKDGRVSLGGSGNAAVDGSNTYLRTTGDIQVNQATGILSNGYYSGGWKFAANGRATALTFDTGDFIFYSLGNNVAGGPGAAATATQRFRVYETGDAQVNNLSGVGNRTVYSTSTGILTNSSSDGTLKEDVQDLRATLRNALQLRPVSFLWKDKERLGSQREIGFIAQEVMQVVPEVVGRNNDGTYTIDYPKLVAVLVGAIQELFDDRTWLARRVQELEDKAAKAEQRLADLEARLARLEAGGNMQ